MNHDWHELSQHFQALGFPNRLRLLSLLQVPRTLDEIDLSPGNPNDGGNPERTLTRQAIQYHLNNMADLGLVEIQQTTRKGGRARNEYRLRRKGILALVDVLRQLATVGAPIGLAPTPGQVSALNRPAGRWRAPHVPRLIIVQGKGEGQCFPLTDSSAGLREWVVGRSETADIVMAWDDAVPGECGAILNGEPGTYHWYELDPGAYGTTVNGTRVEAATRVPLGSGDLIGVGSSVFAFLADLPDPPSQAQRGAPAASANGLTPVEIQSAEAMEDQR
ncbi:MAG: hypothetical protein R3185_06735 [Candidatus Thermoplasmatota archaeon]|nr:hypothetical protein [Candidatus Thermoplasmatota archaeon]